VEDFRLAYRVRGVDRAAIRGVSFRVARGESYGLVGESGCGKSTLAFAAMRYLPRNARIQGGTIRLDGADLFRMDDDALRRLRASTVSMVYQNPGTALNPSIRVGDQVAEAFRVLGADRDEARERARGMLEKVRIADPAGVMRRYPHQLSGGMQQRVVIAMALACDPSLLILDEPTTGLDATVEAEVLDLVAALRREYRTSVLFISHNLGVIARMCDRIGVLYAGRLVEQGATATLLGDPRHPYTVGLLRSVPKWGDSKDRGPLATIPGFPPPIGADIPGCVFADRCALAEDICRQQEPELFETAAGHLSRCFFHDRAQSLPAPAAPPAPTAPPAPISETAATPDPATVPGGRRASSPADSSDFRDSSQKVIHSPEKPGDDEEEGTLVRLEHLSKTFHQDGRAVQALADVTLTIRRGEVLGLVGESGSGKTTLARALLGLTGPDSGSLVTLDATPLGARIAQRTREQVRELQIVFQNPDASLNRRHSVRRIIGRALAKLRGLRGEQRERRVLELTRAVRLDRPVLDAKPAQLSGGLKQRVAIARAFAGDPRMVVCDEPTSALDVSVQAAILNLLVELQRGGVTYLFISHDLGVVRFVADRIAVLYLGRLMELGPAEAVFHGPHHPYTEALLSAAPILPGATSRNGNGAAPSAARERIRLSGEIPSAASPPSGCVFHTRCPRKLGALCEQTDPPFAEAGPGHLIRCHIPVEELRRLQVEGTPAAGPAGGAAPADRSP
jgi:peptide/nickel transport system ATP-binding protein